VGEGNRLPQVVLRAALLKDDETRDLACAPDPEAFLRRLNQFRDAVEMRSARRKRTWVVLPEPLAPGASEGERAAYLEKLAAASASVGRDPRDGKRRGRAAPPRVQGERVSLDPAVDPVTGGQPQVFGRRSIWARRGAWPTPLAVVYEAEDPAHQAAIDAAVKDEQEWSRLARELDRERAEPDRRGGVRAGDRAGPSAPDEPELVGERPPTPGPLQDRTARPSSPDPALEPPPEPECALRPDESLAGLERGPPEDEAAPDPATLRTIGDVRYIRVRSATPGTEEDQSMLFPISVLPGAGRLQQLSKSERASAPRGSTYRVPRRERRRRAIETSAFWDTGASHSFITREYVAELGLKWTRCREYAAVYQADGTESLEMRVDGSVSLTFKMGDLGPMTFTFLVVSGVQPGAWGLGASILLGLDWSRRFNPTVDFAEGKVTELKGPLESWMRRAAATVRDVEIAARGVCLRRLKRRLERKGYEVRACEIKLTPILKTSKDLPLQHHGVGLPITGPEQGDAELYDERDENPIEQSIFEDPAEAARRDEETRQRWSGVFPDKLPSLYDKPIPADRMTFRVELIDPSLPPVSNPVRRFSDRERKAADEMLDEYLRLGLIVPSQSGWSSSLIFIKKKNASGEVVGLRTVLDYRSVNSRLKKFGAGGALPHVADLLDRIRGKKVFSRFDAISGFHQLLVEEGAEHSDPLAFATHRGVFTWKVLPQGISTGPGYFQHLMHTLFSDEIFGTTKLDEKGNVVEREEGHLLVFLMSCWLRTRSRIMSGFYRGS